MIPGNTIRRTIAVTLFIALTAAVAMASPDELDALVESVRQEALQEASHDQERIERFLENRNQQKQMVEDAKNKLAAENRRADQLRANYEKNEGTLTQYELELQTLAGDLNDLFAIVRQTALSANGILESSPVAAEHEERSPFLSDLGKGEKPPSIDDVKQLWTSILTEIVESGKVVRFKATVIKPRGDRSEEHI